MRLCIADCIAGGGTRAPKRRLSSHPYAVVFRDLVFLLLWYLKSILTYSVVLFGEEFGRKGLKLKEGCFFYLAFSDWSVHCNFLR